MVGAMMAALLMMASVPAIADHLDDNGVFEDNGVFDDDDDDGDEIEDVDVEDAFFDGDDVCVLVVTEFEDDSTDVDEECVDVEDAFFDEEDFF